MLARLLLLAVVAFGATATGAAGSPTGPNDSPATQVGAVTVTDGPSDWTSVARDGPAIDFGQNGATGLAPDTRVVIGNPADPASDHAFALRNDGDGPAVVSIQYRYDHRPASGAGVRFTVVAPDGTPLASGPGGAPLSFALAAGATAYVVVTIDTTGTTPNDDLSGTLTFGSYRASDR